MKYQVPFQIGYFQGDDGESVPAFGHLEFDHRPTREEVKAARTDAIRKLREQWEKANNALNN